MLKKIILITLLITIFQFKGKAWVYPEQRDIMLLAILKLDSSHRAFLDRLWASARTGYEARLNLSVVDAAQTDNVKYLDYAAWPGIAGDHCALADNLGLTGGFILGTSPMVIPDPDRGNGAASLIPMRSMQLEFPYLEYRPFRNLSLNQNTSLAV